MKCAVEEWLAKKFHDPRKEELRQSLCATKWRFGLILGNVKFPEEEQAIRDAGIQIVKLAQVIHELEPRKGRKQFSDQTIEAAGPTPATRSIFWTSPQQACTFTTWQG